MAQSQTRTSFSTTILLVMIAVAIVGWFLWQVQSVLLPFIAGLIVAYLMHPLVERAERVGVPRWLGAILGVVLFFVIASGLLLLLVPLLHAQLSGFIDRWPVYATRIHELTQPIHTLLAQQLPQLIEQSSWQDLLSDYGRSFASATFNVVGAFISGGVAVVNVLALVMVTPVVGFYLLRDFPDILEHVRRLIPQNYQSTTNDLSRKISAAIAGFIRGQGLVCLILGLYFGAVLSVVGVEFGLALGLMCGVLAFLPYVGSTLGLLLCVAVTWAQFGQVESVVMVAGLYMLGQFLEGNFLSPSLVGNRVGLNPGWIIFALFAGGSLMGFWGVVVAVPLAASIAVVVRHVLSVYRRTELYQDAAVVRVARQRSAKLNRRKR